MWTDGTAVRRRGVTGLPDAGSPFSARRPKPHRLRVETHG
jgi:hypothetical protein